MKIAIIGSGITGLGAAWALEQGALANKGHIVLYEADNRLGGHSNTVDVALKYPDESERSCPVDTGFIAFNSVNYPNLVHLFEHFHVPTIATDMEFGVSLGRGQGAWKHKQKLEYSASNMFAQIQNYLNPSYLRFTLDILKFFKMGRLAHIQGSARDKTIGEFVEEAQLGDHFIQEFLLPMAAAIWSGTSLKMRDYPADTFLRFFKNHGLLALNELPTWLTVKGGSRVYVEKMAHSLRAERRTGTAVTKIRSLPNAKAVVVYDHQGGEDVFDHVIFACHSDQALRILKDEATASEREILGAIKYRSNKAVLHTDNVQMPKNRGAWASWNYLTENRNDPNSPTAVTYWMNALQRFESPEPIFVSINPFAEIEDRKILREFNYDHPQFDQSALNAQQRVHEIQGVKRRWFAGAWTGYGFHEDGLQSGLSVATALGGKVPWAGKIIPMSPSCQCVDMGKIIHALREPAQEPVQEPGREPRLAPKIKIPPIQKLPILETTQ